jgi:hypothetical protein
VLPENKLREENADKMKTTMERELSRLDRPSSSQSLLLSSVLARGLARVAISSEDEGGLPGSAEEAPQPSRPLESGNKSRTSCGLPLQDLLCAGNYTIVIMRCSGIFFSYCIQVLEKVCVISTT